MGSALAAVEQLTGSAGAVVHIVPKLPNVPVVSLLGASAEGYFIADHVDEWARDYAPICPRLAAPSRFPDAPYFVDYMLLSEREMQLDPVYDWYGSYGLRYFVGCRLFQDQEVEIVWSLQRRREQGHAQQQDIDLFQRLTPHLARSLTLARELGSLRSFKGLGCAIFEAMPQAIFALRSDGRVVFMNESAARLTGKGDGLAVTDRRLHAALPKEQSVLDNMIANAAQAAADSRNGWTRISRRNGAPPLALFVAPFQIEDNDLLSASAKILAIVHDPCARRQPEPQMLTRLYDLTDTEARLASLINSGHSLESAAASLHIQLTTARSHLKSIFKKLGVNRQQDLVGLLTSLQSIEL